MGNIGKSLVKLSSKKKVKFLDDIIEGFNKVRKKDIIVPTAVGTGAYTAGTLLNEDETTYEAPEVSEVAGMEVPTDDMIKGVLAGDGYIQAANADGINMTWNFDTNTWQNAGEDGPGDFGGDNPYYHPDARADYKKRTQTAATPAPYIKKTQYFQGDTKGDRATEMMNDYERRKAEARAARALEKNSSYNQGEDTMSRPLTPFFETLIKTAAPKGPSKPKTPVLSNEAKTKTVKDLKKTFPKKTGKELAEARVSATGGTKKYKSYLDSVQKHIGSKATDIDSMYHVYGALANSGLPQDVIDELKHDWFGDESNIDWTPGSNGQIQNQLQDQIRAEQESRGIDPNTAEEAGGVFAGNMPFTSVPEGLAQEAAKIKAKRESMNQPEKDMANMSINTSDPNDFAQTYDSPTDQAMYERGIRNLRNRVGNLGIPK